MSGQHPKQCVCTVCTCGRHHCPPPVAPERHYTRDELTSEYGKDFHAMPLPERTARPAPAAPVSVPFSGTSQYRDEFVPMPLEARSPAPVTAPPRSLPFEGESTAHHDYVRNELPKREPRRPQEYTPSGAKFDGRSTNAETFRPPSPDAYARPQSPSKMPVARQLPFEGESTAHHDYDRKPMPQRQAREVPKYNPSGAKFDGNTTNNLTYRPPSPNDYQRPQTAQLQPMPERHYDRADLQSEYARDFDRKPIPERQPRTPHTPASPSAPFQGQSTNRDAFQRPPADAYARPQSASFQPVVQRPFEGNTQYREEFQPKPLSPRQSARPAPAAGPHVPFQGASVNHVDYSPPPKEAYAQTPVRGAPQPAASLPFQGESTSHHDFDRKPLPNQAPRNVQHYVPNTTPFKGESTCHHDFPGHQIDVCPAQLLPRRPPSPEKHVYYEDQIVDRARERAKELSPPRHR